MKKTQVLTGLGGVVAGFAMSVCFGAAKPVAPQPRLQLTTLGENLFVHNLDTNEVFLLFKKRVDGKSPPDWPWAVDNTFSLTDAISDPKGAEIKPGRGRN